MSEKTRLNRSSNVTISFTGSYSYISSRLANKYGRSVIAGNLLDTGFQY